MCAAMPDPAASPRFRPTLTPWGLKASLMMAVQACTAAMVSEHSSGVSSVRQLTCLYGQTIRWPLL